MTKLEVYDVSPVGVNSYCAVLTSQESNLFVPIHLDGESGGLVRSFLNEECDEHHMVMFSFLSSNWSEMDAVPVFCELYEEYGMCSSKIVTYQKNEVSEKFFKVEAPLAFSLVISLSQDIPILMDDKSIKSFGARGIEELEAYLEKCKEGKV